MSAVTEEIFATASASASQCGLTSGTAAAPVHRSWAEVHTVARRMAGALAGLGVGPGASVAVLAADAGDVAPLVQALWMRRAAITMLQQPTPRTDLTVWLSDTVRVVDMLHADLVVVGEPFLEAVAHIGKSNLPVAAMSALRQGEPCELLDATESDVALRQLTSGSTGTPKAVEISHGNLAANGIAIRTALAIVPGRDVSVSWLPFSHDMGMIAFLCLPMQIGSEAVVVTPDQFLRRPIVWAELISRYKATITSGPNFAYTVLARLLQRAAPASIDLSSLRVAVNGAEPIDQKDLSTFAEVGARFGLRASAPRPAYGLAEATLVVSFGPPDCAPVVDRVP